jgi:hypothetical protein
MRPAHDGLSAASLECCGAAAYLLPKKKRSSPMITLFKTLISNRVFPTLAELERDYLNASVSRVDLERRQREVDNGLFRRSSFDL